MADLSIDKVVEEIKNLKLNWQPKENSMTRMSSADRSIRLGIKVNEPARVEMMKPTAQAIQAAFEKEVDWRNRNNRNYVSSVKDQEDCGSCVSFCVVAALESLALIEHNVVLDLSEADLHFCSDHGPNCEGWWPNEAADELKSRGVIPEIDFPYNSAFQGGFPVCLSLDGKEREEKAVRIEHSGSISDITARKNHLTSVGPCSAVIEVFDDFFSYSSGVYSHATGNSAGYHCIEVIGYSELEQCWICKNSWGNLWGDNGFFKISYGEAGIDTEFPFWTIQGVILP